MRDSAAFLTADAATGQRLLSRHLENASRFAALYAQRARRLVLPTAAGAAPTVAPCTPSKRFHYCMACSGSSLERACDVASVEDVPETSGQTAVIAHRPCGAAGLAN